MKALYTHNYAEILFLIPKLRGSGYVKAPFGGHHGNAHYLSIMDRLSNIDFVSLIDVDGYVCFDFDKSGHYESDLEAIKTAIKEEFKRVTEFEYLTWTSFLDKVEENHKSR
jgi:hypothetical protein